MKRGFQLLIFIMGAFGFWWVLTPPPELRLKEVLVVKNSPKRAPAQSSSSAPALPLLPTPIKRPPTRQVLELPEHSTQVDEERPPLQSGKHRWHFLAGLSAIARGAGGGAGLDGYGEFSGYQILSTADVPAGVESFALVKRADNGIVGIFTRVIRAVGERGAHSAQFVNECPQGAILESYPVLKSYLLRAHSSTDDQEYFECLSALGRFKSLDWEILDHPRSHR